MIRIEHVTHAYGDRVVVDDVSLDLREHRIGLIGANGSGKSTLARMVNGLIVPDTGRVLVDGLDTRDHVKEIRRRVGFVFPDADTQIIMPTVAEDVRIGLRDSGLSRDEIEARVDEVLARHGLLEHRDHPAHLLSSGQKQMLALASVLVTEPQILVCDEPTTLLDLLQRADHHGDLAHPAPAGHPAHPPPRHAQRLRPAGHGRRKIVFDGAPEDAVAYYVALMEQRP